MRQELESNEINGEVSRSKTYSIYTILFCTISFIIFAVFMKYNKSFIWQADGIKQHFVILYDFNQIIRNIFKEGIPMLSWNMGLGLDIIGQYSYYIIGDPFAYLSLLFPMEKLEIAYNILVVLRIYCVGLAFIAYCKYRKKEGISTLIGGIVYTFCGFILYAGIRHPYFTNAAILLPLNLIGIEKLLKENKKIYLIFIVFVSVVNNYYFFYMITIISAIYGIIKYVFEYNQGTKEFFKKIGNAILCYIVGILMASAILLPTVYTFLNSARTECERLTTYISQFYEFFFLGIISIRFKNWTVIAVSSIIILMIPILFTKLKDKEARSYLSLFFITTLMLLIPQVGSAMNGFSFPNNRWIFAYSFIVSYIITICFNRKFLYSKKQKVIMFVILVFYSLIGAFITKLNIKQNIDYYASIVIAFLIFTFMCYPYKKDKCKIRAIYLIIFLVIMSIFINSMALYSIKGKGYVEEFINNGEAESKCASVNGKIKNFKEAIEYIKENDKEFYRISKKEVFYQNLSLMYDYNPIQLFLSLGNGNVYELSSDLEDNCYSSTQCVNGANRRTKYTTLLGNKYYICDKEDIRYVPYGYTLYHGIGETLIYINENYLPIGIIYDSYITDEQFKKLTPLEKEDSLITTAMVENCENIDVEENIDTIIDKPIILNYTVNDNKIINNTITTSKKNESIELTIDKISSNVELYISINNLKYISNDDSTDFKITARLNGITDSEELQDCISSAYYMNNPNFLINLGISKKGQDKNLKLTFNKKGTYTFDSLEILAVDMNKYKEKIDKLKLNTMQNIKYGNNYIEGTVNTNKNGILQITTSYSKGWRAYVNDKEVDVFKVNEAFIGISVEEGRHNVRFEYTTPYLKIGVIISFIGLLLYISIIMIDKNKK